MRARVKKTPVIEPNANARVTRWSRAVVTVLGAYALIGGLVSFLGWAADAPRLTDWEGSGVSIQPNTTVAVMACGAAILAQAWGRRRVGTRRVDDDDGVPHQPMNARSDVNDFDWEIRR